MTIRQLATDCFLRPKHRASNLFLSILGLLTVLGGLGLQYGLAFGPCPLCIFQRIGFLSCSAFFGLSAILKNHKRSALLFHGLGVLASLIGLGIACQHLHIVYYPVAESCGADLGYLHEILDTASLLAKVFKGDAECAEAGQRLFLWLPVPAWSMSIFFGIFVQSMRTLINESKVLLDVKIKA